MYRAYPPAGSMYRAYPPAGSITGRVTPPHGSGDDAGGIDLSAPIENPYIKQRVIVGEDYETYIPPASGSTPECVTQTGGDDCAIWLASQNRCGCKGQFFRQTDAQGSYCGCPTTPPGSVEMVPNPGDSQTCAQVPSPTCSCPPNSSIANAGTTNARCNCQPGYVPSADRTRCVAAGSAPPPAAPPAPTTLTNQQRATNCVTPGAPGYVAGSTGWMHAPTVGSPRCACANNQQIYGTAPNQHCGCPPDLDRCPNTPAGQCWTKCATGTVRNAACSACVVTEAGQTAQRLAAARTTITTIQTAVTAARIAAQFLPTAQRTPTLTVLDQIQGSLTQATARISSGDITAISVLNDIATRVGNIRQAAENLANLQNVRAAAPPSQVVTVQAQMVPAQQAVAAALVGADVGAQNLANQAAMDAMRTQIEQLTGQQIARVGESKTPAWVLPAAVGGGILLLGLTGLVIYKSTRKPEAR